ncbi:MAG: MarR family transcriptional regulator [Chloroflexi bacterium]|nr:MAG: MarR family transcriptional regulator [Chloroflexota bacterium]
MKTDEITIADYQALGEFRYQIRRFIRYSERVAREAGIEPQQHQLLLAIKGLPAGNDATISNLAERLQIQHHSTVELVDRLEERGMVVRSRDENDLRRVLVKLTSQGEEMLHNLSHHSLTELRSIGPTLVVSLNELLKEAGPMVQDEQAGAGEYEEEGE